MVPGGVGIACGIAQAGITCLDSGPTTSKCLDAATGVAAGGVGGKVLASRFGALARSGSGAHRGSEIGNLATVGGSVGGSIGGQCYQDALNGKACAP
jgi:hypothetical protein